MAFQTPPSDNIFVGDLPPGITHEVVASVFSAHGTVTSCRIMPSKQPGVKAAALVRFASVEEAAEVVRSLNGNVVEGLDSPIVCRFANAPGTKPQSSWASKGGYGSGKGGGGFPANYDGDGARQGGEPPVSDNVFVGDLPEDFTQDQCLAVFQNYGAVTSCRVMPPKQAGKKASALVRFSSADEASWVVENLNGNIAEGILTPIVVRFANTPGSTGAATMSASGGTMWANNRSEPYPSRGKGSGKNGGKGGGEGTFYALYGQVKKSGLLGGSHVPNECQLYVRNLPKDTTDLDLYRLFAPFGAIAPTGAKAMSNPDGSCKGIGFVDFVNPTCCQAAITALNNFTTTDGNVLMMTTKSGNGKKGGGKGYGGDAQ
mmetsp:Transcript_64865/g.163420  ORF Transcript_64865/g.163420 Transcript_64865/m.163420 type:complete len:373 (+) Transcript_64865:91-1209(+)|eukprot:CAMPEP_0115284858 /NCGR_PEP_ID=MMETSP0270-20121206/61121_1 /TAXON_ID=71861 /ORGANISM="Scrippsiella trochoidea, Strain CCMP3099" /LENGTH=372 /DNA_ID=CAMNT_0002701841 /DNA_START=93 /DNA_END=1211 /DNA_ORIENTATION=+